MLAERLIPATYLQQASAAKKSRENLIRQLIEQVSMFVYYKASQKIVHAMAPDTVIKCFSLSSSSLLLMSLTLCFRVGDLALSVKCGFYVPVSIF